MNFVGANSGTSPEAAYEALSLASVREARIPDRIAIPRLPYNTSQLLIFMLDDAVVPHTQPRKARVISFDAVMVSIGNLTPILFALCHSKLFQPSNKILSRYESILEENRCMSSKPHIFCPTKAPDRLSGRFIGAPWQEHHQHPAPSIAQHLWHLRRQDDGRSVRGAHALHSAAAASECFSYFVTESCALCPQISRFGRGPSLVHSGTA